VSLNDYHWYDECPSAGQPCPSGDGTASCSNLTDSGNVTSMQFLKSCVQGLTPYADVSVNFDNTGTIGDFSDDGSTRPECTLGAATGTSSVQVIDEGNYVRLRISYTYKNANHGGPYGITGSVRFFFFVPINGCTNPCSPNYDYNANINDGSCLPELRGCTDYCSSNYNPNVNYNCDDGSCLYDNSNC
jgi:hypothetical protein